MRPLVPQIGISGFASYIPRYRVKLADWCKWTGDNWDKVRAVVGSSFRMRGPNENAYTMAATAVLRLIDQYQIDPQQVGYLALGTESSTDNSAGAVIVKGMVNKGLTATGKNKLRRACEVPEFKHACLGGVYAMKAAARFLALDGNGKVAIVVCSDVAEYERATSGEPTQGAGAVAMLIEADPKLLALELQHSGSASEYRGPDFRKPFYRFMGQVPGEFGQPRDFPVFNGKYSTTCYIDEVLAAMRDMFSRLDTVPSHFLKDLTATFLHRPYQRMAETGLIMSYLLALAIGDAEDHAELDVYAQAADVDTAELVLELTNEPDVFALVDQQELSTELYPLTSQTARTFRASQTFSDLMTTLGDAEMQEIGNLYTASLPAWMASGIEDAWQRDMDLGGGRILTIGYGSGDAAEIIPMILVPEWREAASKIAFQASLDDSVDLDEKDYHSLHKGDRPAMAVTEQTGVFYIDHVGQRDGQYDNFGVEYYRYQAS
jgi:hydroxymethylglutaryl-CoA synthase